MTLVTIKSDKLIDIVDMLNDAQIELHAIYLAANALQRNDMDAFQRLANGIDNSIEPAKDSIQRLIDQARANQAEGHGNG